MTLVSMCLKLKRHPEYMDPDKQTNVENAFLMMSQVSSMSVNLCENRQVLRAGTNQGSKTKGGNLATYSVVDR